MKNKFDKKSLHLDETIKQAFQNDCPEEVESRLLQQVDDFGFDQTPSFWLKPFFTILKPSRLLLGSLSIIVFLIGNLIQFSGHTNLLSESITVFKACNRLYENLDQASSMECIVTITAPEKSPVRYQVLWKPPEVHQINCFSANKIVSSRSLTGSQTVPITDIPIKHLKTPRDIRQLLHGQWLVSDFKDVGGRSIGQFTVTSLIFHSPIKVTVNLSSMRLEAIQKSMVTKSGKIEIRATFKWGSQVIVPENLKIQKSQPTDIHQSVKESNHEHN